MCINYNDHKSLKYVFKGVNYYLGKANVVADALSLEEIIEEFEHLKLKVKF